MKEIGIFVGEDADIPHNIAKKLDITVYPFTTSWDALSDKKELYAVMRTASQKGITTSPKTSQPSASVFSSLFEKGLQNYTDIIVITISKELSGCFNSATQAVKMLPKEQEERIHIIDSRASTGAEGLLAIALQQMVEEKKSIDVILSAIPQIKISLLGTFDNPYWLKMGGRLNGVQAAIVGQMIAKGFRPILNLKNGQITTHKIQIGAKDTVAALYKQFQQEVSLGEHITIAITHGDCLEQAKELEKLLTTHYPHATIVYTHTMSAVIGAHVGPDSLVVSWMYSV